MQMRDHGTVQTGTEGYGVEFGFEHYQEMAALMHQANGRKCI